MSFYLCCVLSLHNIYISIVNCKLPFISLVFFFFVESEGIQHGMPFLLVTASTKRQVPIPILIVIKKKKDRLVKMGGALFLFCLEDGKQWFEKRRSKNY